MRIIRAAVAITAIIAAVVLISLAFSSGRSRRQAPPSGPPPTSDAGIVGRLILPSDVSSGMALIKATPQRLIDIASGSTDPTAESQRLSSLGFEEAAIVQMFKPQEAGGALSNTALTSQIIRFKSPEGALRQLDHDRSGALAADFGIRKIDESTPLKLGDSAVLIRGRPSGGSGDEPTIWALAAAKDEWESVVTVTSASPIPEDVILEIARRQLDLV